MARKIVQELDISKIELSPYQTRKYLDNEKMKELAHSIILNGLLQPISVRQHKTKKGFYELIAGERRFKVMHKLGYEFIPGIVYDFDDDTTQKMVAIENLHRLNLNPLEEAEAIKQLINKYGYTQSKIQESISKSRSAIANSIRLLELPKTVQQMIREEVISSSFGRALLGLKDSRLIEEWANNAVIRKLSVNALEKKISLLNKEDTNVKTNEEAPITNDYENEFKNIFKTKWDTNKVKVKELKNNHFEVKININKDKLEELKKLLENN